MITFLSKVIAVLKFVSYAKYVYFSYYRNMCLRLSTWNWNVLLLDLKEGGGRKEKSIDNFLKAWKSLKHCSFRLEIFSIVHMDY